MGGGAFLPSDFDFHEWQDVGKPWTATTFSLPQLREFGLDPSSIRAKRAVELIGVNSRWDHADEPYWEGEVEECINGRTVLTAPISGSTSRPSSTGWSVSVLTTAVGTARGPTVRFARRRAAAVPAQRRRS